MSPHGLTNSVYFYPNEGVSMALVADKLKAIPEMYRRKFRMVFSTACYGASHIDEWLDSGFQVASGSEKIYADSLLSFPAFLGTWVLGGSFQDAINAANAADPYGVQDRWLVPNLMQKGITNMQTTSTATGVSVVTAICIFHPYRPEEATGYR